MNIIIKNKIKLLENSVAERYKDLSLLSTKRSKIIIYLFDLTKDDDIKEGFINSIKKIIEIKN